MVRARVRVRVRVGIRIRVRVRARGWARRIERNFMLDLRLIWLG